ncbi:DUF1344 domain-containing protein [Chelativorans sp. ZYF759]|uniref:DUF1344 domain-containing protein n=1 Tax=Chelativorans sp. ZYF759 TaxID=2692213 RepID=UPI00145ECB0D|nr:DUF1344 domain-containing protein [Chelativorans sp. ZYF759]NMG40611.1 DUF1344 domain-containing protein [Chelativorans sp. ZYF759]
MKKFVATLAASAAMIGFAYAGEAEGTVASVDAETSMITLETGETFVAQDGVDIGMIAPGSQVRITYDDDTMEATDVEAM